MTHMVAPRPNHATLRARPWWAYVLAETTRRRRRALAILLITSLGIALAVSLEAVAASLDSAEASALGPIRGIDRDLYVSRAAPSATAGQPASAELQAFLAERQATITAAVTDLASLGAPGQHFEHDFFLPETAYTFPQSDLSRAAGIPGVETIAGGLRLIAIHRQGTVPDIVAEYTVEPQTITLAPPTAADFQIMNDCVAKSFQSGQGQQTSPPPTKTPGSEGAATPVQFTRAYYACLPPRLRQVQLEGRLIEEVINPPTTDITQSTLSVTGVDTSLPTLGLLTSSSIVAGSYFSPGSSGETVLSEAYAAHKGLVVGATMTFAGSRYEVVGIARPALRGLTSDVYLPLAELQRLSGRQGRINVIVVRAASNAQVAEVSRGLEATLAGARVASDRDTAGQVTGSLSNVAAVIRTTKPVALVAILAATLLMVALMSFSAVGRRAQELGMLRMIGWRRSQVVSQITAELLLLGLAGSVLGLIVAQVLLIAIARVIPPQQLIVLASSLGEQLQRPLSEQRVALDPHLDLVGVGLALSAGLLGSLIASVLASARAVRVTPSDSLRRVA